MLTAPDRADKRGAQCESTSRSASCAKNSEAASANKDDTAAIEAIAAHGYPAVEPILLDLLKWIRQDSWPVAKPACEFRSDRATVGAAGARGPRFARCRPEGRRLATDCQPMADRGRSRPVGPVFLIATDGQ